MRDTLYITVAILIIIVPVFMIGLNVGSYNTKGRYMDHCIAKYGDMPANKVEQHCREIMEFK